MYPQKYVNIVQYVYCFDKMLCILANTKIGLAAFLKIYPSFVMIHLHIVAICAKIKEKNKENMIAEVLVRLGAISSVEHIPRLRIGWTWRGRTKRRYPLDPRLDGIFIHLTKVCGVNTSQQWSISDQVAPRPTLIVTYLSDVPYLRYRKITVGREDREILRISENRRFSFFAWYDVFA